MMIDNEIAWSFALGLIKVDRLTVFDEMIEMIEMEKRGEITTQEMTEKLKEKYRTGGSADRKSGI